MGKLPLACILAFFVHCRSSQAEIDQTLFYEYVQAEVPGLMKKYSVPGAAIAILQKEEVFAIECFGYNRKGSEKRIHAKSIFQIASISKPLTAWGVLKLVEKGIISLDSPIETYLHRWHIPVSRYSSAAVTPRRLLNHTSGFSTSAYPGYPSIEAMPSLVESLMGEKGSSAPVQLEYSPGEKFQYSGGGYTILQLLIEEATQQHFQSYMKTEILMPLNLIDTSFSVDFQKEICSPHGIFGQPLAPSYFIEEAAAGGYSTIQDLALFLQHTLRGYREGVPNVLSSHSIREMIEVKETSYGLGYDVEVFDNRSFFAYHLGANPGWRAGIFFLPGNGSGLVILTNSDHGMLLIQDLVENWTMREMGKIPEFVKEAAKEKRYLVIVLILVAFLLVAYLFSSIQAFLKKKRVLRSKFSVWQCLNLAFWTFLCIAWWIFFYRQTIHKGWTLAPFLPYRFEWLTILVMFASILGFINACFAKKQ